MNLYSKIEGVYEVMYAAAPMATEHGTFMRGYVATYYSSKEGIKKNIASIQFLADGEVADQIAALNLQKGDYVHIVGKLGSRKETRFKDDKGNDVYFSCIRVDSLEIAKEESRQPYVKPTQAPKPTATPSTPAPIPAELVINDDDLPF